MTITEPFALAAAIDQVVPPDRPPARVDAQEAADRVIDLIPEDALRAIVRQLLPDAVRRRLGERRRAVLRRRGETWSDRMNGVKRAHDAQELFATAVFVPEHGMVQIGDCTPDMLGAAAGWHENQAESHAWWGARLRQLAEKTTTIVRDLPAAEVWEVFA